MEPIKFYIELNAQLNLVEFYCGHDNPGCHLLVNKVLHQEMASGPEPEEPPEFQRGPTINDFDRGPTYETLFQLYDDKTQSLVKIRVFWL